MNKIIKCHVLPWIMNQIKYFSFIGQKLMKNNSSEENWKVNLQTTFKSCCDCQLEIKLCWAKQFSRRVWDDSKDYYRRGNARQCVSTSSGDKRGNLFFVPGQFILPRPESIVVGSGTNTELYNYCRGANFTWTVSLWCPVTGTKWLSLSPHHNTYIPHQ